MILDINLLIVRFAVARTKNNMPIPDKSSSRSGDKAHDDGRSPIVQGYIWATIITTMTIQLVLPILLGVYADYRFGTKYIFLFLGIFLSLLIMVVNFVKLMKSKEFSQSGSSGKSEKQGKTDR
jgi:F0F1-type ATP synthase assembly protein I